MAGKPDNVSASGAACGSIGAETRDEAELLRHIGVIAIVCLLHAGFLAVLMASERLGRSVGNEPVATLISIPSNVPVSQPPQLPVELESPHAANIRAPSIDIRERASGSETLRNGNGESLPPRLGSLPANAVLQIPAELSAIVGAGRRVVVVVKVLVLEDGRAGDVVVLSSSGFSKLDEMAAEEVKENWRFVPGTLHGQKVRDWITLEVLLGAA